MTIILRVSKSDYAIADMATLPPRAMIVSSQVIVRRHGNEKMNILAHPKLQAEKL